MRPAPAVILAGLLAGATLFAACGEDGDRAYAPAVSRAAAEGAPRPSAAGRRDAGAARRCRSELGEMLEILDALRNQLAVGMSYEGYEGLVREAKEVHEEVRGDRLGLACLALVGTPAEAALNEYIDGVNEWGECLAAAGCGEAEVEPALQQSWRRAARSTSAAERGLRRMGG